MISTHSGLGSIQATFARAKAEGRAAFMPFFTVGYPTLPDSIEALVALAESGADALEVGMPFSDPLADGPVIQHASNVALAQGTKLRDCLAAIRTLRARGVTIPLILMGYVNPVLNYGLERFVSEAAEAGVSGLIL
ncbi:MAG TPA: tryptophan synthase subunit alpha, partial [Aggregatilineales bacterium]|nr:tryptophan synthase subunit alpha [Aggregatilineales bacterium]